MPSPYKRSAVAILATAATFAAFMVLASMADSPWSSQPARNGYIAIWFVVVASSLSYAVNGSWLPDLKEEVSPWAKGSNLRTRGSWLISTGGLVIYYLALLTGPALLLYAHFNASASP